MVSNNGVCTRVTNNGVCTRITNNGVCTRITNNGVCTRVTNNGVCTRITNKQTQNFKQRNLHVYVLSVLINKFICTTKSKILFV